MVSVERLSSSVVLPPVPSRAWLLPSTSCRTITPPPPLPHPRPAGHLCQVSNLRASCDSRSDPSCDASDLSSSSPDDRATGTSRTPTPRAGQASRRAAPLDRRRSTARLSAAGATGGKPPTTGRPDPSRNPFPSPPDQQRSRLARPRRSPSPPRRSPLATQSCRCHLLARCC